MNKRKRYKWGNMITREWKWNLFDATLMILMVTFGECVLHISQDNTGADSIVLPSFMAYAVNEETYDFYFWFDYSRKCYLFDQFIQSVKSSFFLLVGIGVLNQVYGHYGRKTYELDLVEVISMALLFLNMYAIPVERKIAKQYITQKTSRKDRTLRWYFAGMLLLLILSWNRQEYILLFGAFNVVFTIAIYVTSYWMLRRIDIKDL